MPAGWLTLAGRRMVHRSLTRSERSADYGRTGPENFVSEFFYVRTKNRKQLAFVGRLAICGQFVW